MNAHFLYLALAIVTEVAATTALKATDGFTRLMPSLCVVVGYSCAFFFLSLAMKVLPVGVIYAIWSGCGIVLVSIVAWLVYGQTLDVPAVVGIALIVAGVIVLNGFSQSAAH
ncbi:MAG: QacE family quaternary ammonium compound efflux SMR transporter [Zoogloeaceae bacterium]|jgi:small multidrug resistance pump|nr:QacE family quaternary ammonium compound efflux SMR transporter [Zoogloeaceae bacterium]